MSYLDPTEYVAYGLTAETTDDWVAMASALIDAHCRRQSLLVMQHVERMRLTAGSQSVRLSYLPLTPLGTAASPLVGVRVRYGRPRRGEMQYPMLAQVAWAFSIPGSWSSLDITSLDMNVVTGEGAADGDDDLGGGEIFSEDDYGAGCPDRAGCAYAGGVRRDLPHGAAVLGESTPASARGMPAAQPGERRSDGLSGAG